MSDEQTSTDAFAEAVRRVTAATDDDAIAAVIARAGGAGGGDGALVTGVTGRPGAGKSTLIAALSERGGSIVAAGPLLEVHGVDAPDAPAPVLDQDVLLHVVAREITAADRALLAARGSAPTLTVVGRPDLPFRPSVPDRSGSANAAPVRGDDLDAIVRWWEAARIEARRRRHRVLCGDLEIVAAARPATRAAVETFLRDPVVMSVRGSR